MNRPTTAETRKRREAARAARRSRAKVGGRGRPRPYPTKTGFTLLEMLVAILVTAVLVATAVQAYLDITRRQERAGAGATRDRVAEVFLDRLERELVGSVLVVLGAEVEREKQAYVFVGQDAFDAEHETDSIRFVTQTPARAAGASVSGGVRVVSYSLVETDDGTLALARSEGPLPRDQGPQLAPVEPQAVLDDVAELRLRYVDETSQETRDTWDSTAEPTLDRLPLDVSVAIALYEKDEAGERVPGSLHERQVHLPVREIDLDAMREAATGGADGEGCVTVADCVERFQTELFASPEGTEAAQEALAADSESCFQASGALADAIRRAGGDPASCR